MLTKLLKYELKATGRKLLPLYGALILFALLNKLFLVERVFDSLPIPDSLSLIINFISVFGYGCIMTAVFVLTLFITIQRFYKNLLGDQGYLMHTLPLEPRKNIISKLLVSVIWNIVSCLVAGISIFMLIYNANTAKLFTEVFPEIILFLKENGYSFSLITFECIILCLLSLCKSIIKIYASISIGHLFNSKRILLSFVSFIGLNILESIFSTILGKLFNLSSIFDSVVQPTMNDITIVIIFLVIIEILCFAAYFFITNYILKNKLNLE